MTTKIDLFRHATEFETFKAGDVVFAEGDAGETMYVVKDGQVEIIVGGSVFRTLEAGEIFGEMALIDTKIRSAAARAKTDCELVPVDEERFCSLVQQTPLFALDVMRVLAHRLRSMSAMLGAGRADQG